MSTDRIDTTGGVRGWGFTPTGDPPAVAIPSDERDNKKKTLPTALHKGWRRNALYGILIFLMILIFTNIALTLWIITALKLTMAGIGPIKIVRGGVQLEGQAWVTDKLVTSTISSRLAQPVTMQSYRNFTILVSDPAQTEQAKLLIKRDTVTCNGRTFDVQDNHGNSVFQASRDEVRLTAETMTIDGVGGLIAKAALQTPFVKAPPGSDLQLESLTRRLHLRAPQSIHLESRAGSIDITSQSNIKLDSVVGAIKIESSNIVIKNLMAAEATNTSHKIKNVKSMKVYQLCACATGKLFLAAADGLCATYDNDAEICR